MLFYRGRQRILDSNGDPVSGAKLNFYLTGTTTRADTYTDSDLTTEHANPVIASSAGFVEPIYLDPTVTYKCVITRSNDVALPDGTVDPVSAAFDSETIGIALNYRTAAEIAASVTPVNYAYEPGNVLRYGTNTTPGTTDMTTAINNAILSNDNVYIPAGTYLISSSIIWRDYVKIEGAGYLATTIKGSMASRSFFRSSYGESPAIGERPTGVHIAHLSIQPDSIAASSIGVNFKNSQYMTLEHVLIKNVATGFATDQIAQYNNYIGVKVQVATTGAYLESSGGGNKLIGCDIAGNTIALDLHSGAYDVLGGTYEALQTSTTYCIRAGRPGGSAVSFTITGAYIEGTDASIIPFQAENSVSGSRFSAELHGTLGSIVNNATLGELVISARSYNSPFTRSQLVQFSATLAGSVQSCLRSNGSGTVEVRNGANDAYADLYAKNLLATGTAAGVSGTVSIGSATQSTVGGAGGASALPATPAGYLRFFVGTTERVMPFYPVS